MASSTITSATAGASRVKKCMSSEGTWQHHWLPPKYIKTREAHYLEIDLAAPLHQLPPEHLKQESAPSKKRFGSTVILTVTGYPRSRNAQSRKGPWEMAD